MQEIEKTLYLIINQYFNILTFSLLSSYCLSLKKVDSQNELTMFIYQTKKRELYYDRVIELYKQTGYGRRRLAKLIPELDEKTISRWIANFVAENGKVTPQQVMQEKETANAEEIKALKAKIADLEEQLRQEKMRGRLNDKIIEIAEKKYNIQIRKKAGAKQ